MNLENNWCKILNSKKKIEKFIHKCGVEIPTKKNNQSPNGIANFCCSAFSSTKKTSDQGPDSFVWILLYRKVGFLRW